MVTSTAFATSFGGSVCPEIPWSVCPETVGQLAPKWCGLIHHNLQIDTYRRNTTGKKVFHNITNATTELYAAPDEALEYKETLRIINQAIDTLSPQQKLIYQKCRMEGKSHEEVAKELSLSRKTVANHITAANRTVTSYLREYAKRHTYDQGIFLLCLWMYYQH